MGNTNNVSNNSKRMRGTISPSADEQSLSFDEESFDDLMYEIIGEFNESFIDEDDDEDHHAPKLPKFILEIDCIGQYYKKGAVLGKGVSGEVYVAHCRQTHHKYALKQMIHSDPLNYASFMRETNILRKLKHPNIVRYRNAYISNDYYCITTEYCSGGTLLERMLKMKRLTERKCADFVKEILRAMDYLHSHHIVHRDIKLSNIVFNDRDLKRSRLKLIDFGQSEIITNSEKPDKNVVGSLSYLPPETLSKRRKRHLFAADMWAIGVVAYILIQGVPPFSAKDVKSMMKCIATTKLPWQKDIPLSDSCKHFVHGLLNKNCKLRLTARQALKHPWITKQAKDDDLGNKHLGRLRELNYQNHLQKILVNAALGTMSDAEKQLIFHAEYDNDNQLINSILSGSPSLRQPQQQQHMTLPQTVLSAESSSKSLDECVINTILNGVPSASTKLECASVSVTSTPEMDDELDLKRFVQIMQSCSKRYDIPKIVNGLTDAGTEPITYKKISCYHETLESLDSVL